MEVTLKKEELRSFRNVYRARIEQEETMEAVVPDSLPDAEELLDADAVIFLRSKETEDGAVTTAAQLQGSILYRGEGGGIYTVPLSCAVSLRWEDADIRREDQVQLRLRAVSCDARPVNPRKLLLRCSVEAEAECYREEVCEYTTEAEGEGIRQRQIKENVGLISEVKEKTFVISEELPLSDGEVAEEILLSRISSSVEDVRDVAGKAVVQGKLHLELLYLAEETPKFREYTVPFSQILDAPEDVSFTRITLLPTAYYMEILPGGFGRGFALEAHMVAQATFCTEKEICCLADAYSTVCPEKLDREEITFSAPGREQSRRITLRDTAELREDVSSILWCYVNSLRTASENNGTRLTAHAHVYYRNGAGETSCTQIMLKDETNEELTAGHIELRAVECYASPLGKGIEVRAALEMCSTEDTAVTITPVNAVRLAAEEPYELRKRPALTAVRNTDGDIWALAKKYLTTTELIEEANPGMREIGSFLLIPRVR